LSVRQVGNPIRIGLLWHSPNSGNLGVGALTVANMALAREVAAGLGLEPEFLIIGMRDGEAHYIADPKVGLLVVDSRTLLKPGGCWAKFARLDCILDIGAGDSFADIYGPKRFLFLWLTKMIAIARRVPLLLSPQTIGPFTRTPYRQLAAIAMNRAAAVIARDQKSLDVLRRLSPRANGVLAVDASHLRGGERIRVGVNVSGLLFNEAESGANRFGLDVDYVELTRRLIGKLLARADVEVHLVAHATAMDYPWDDDGRIADRLASEFPQAIRVPNFATPSAAKSYISGLDFLVAGRMHACIAAFSAGVPVVPVAYSRKFSGLFGMLGYEWMVPVTGTDTDGALAYIEHCLERRELLAADEAKGMTKVGALLDAYRAELRTLFNRARAR
jgi:polysaccharide pyruvyl transferase WcaK-like protein